VTRAFALALGLFVAAAQAQERVVAERHRAFWLWGGVPGRSFLAQAESVYLLQGEIGLAADGAPVVEARSLVSPGRHAAPLYLVYRVRSLDFTPEVFATLRTRLARWRREAGEVRGVQIDFDSGTKRLKEYAQFLRALRRELPADASLSVTGLMDWASQAASEDLNELAGVADEIVFQTYRGRSTIANVDAYVARLSRLSIPFKLGLVEGGVWREPSALAANPLFRGYVVFLLNRPAAGE
jgi:hypothetical protein